MNTPGRIIFLIFHFSLFVSATAQPPAADEPALTVDELVEEVLAANPELTLYEAEIEAARGDRRQAGRWTNPEFTLEAGRKRVREPGAGAAEGAAWAASVAQPIEFPGRRALRKAIADRNTELAELGLENFRRVLEKEVKVHAYSLYATRRIVESVDEVAARAKELTDVVLQRETGGVSPLLEGRILESSAVTLQQRRRMARQAYRKALIELNQLRGVAAETPVLLAEPRLDLPDPAPAGELVRRAWRNAFEAKAREVELEQQGFRLRLEENERYPTITVSPYVSRASAGERETEAGVALSFALPIWDRNSGTIEAEGARLRQAEGALLVARRDLERRVVAEAMDYAAARESLAAFRPEALDDFEEAAALAERHYRLGAISISTYLEMQTAYLDALEALLATRLEAMESRLELELLTGDLSREDKK